MPRFTRSAAAHIAENKLQQLPKNAQGMQFAENVLHLFILHRCGHLYS